MTLESPDWERRRNWFDFENKIIERLSALEANQRNLLDNQRETNEHLKTINGRCRTHDDLLSRFDERIQQARSSVGMDKKTFASTMSVVAALLFGVGKALGWW